MARVYGPRIVSIAKLDLRQQFDLNLDASQYCQSSLDWLYSPRQPLEKLRRLAKDDMKALGITKKYTVAVPFSNIETVTKDTGERKKMFGYLARHVITTTRSESPLEDSHRGTQESTTDGWYIDLEPQSYPVLYPSLLMMHSPSCKFSAKNTEFALQELTNAQFTVTLPDGSTGRLENRTETLVTIEKGTYDVALFEVPSGFKCVTQNQQFDPIVANTANA